MAYCTTADLMLGSIPTPAYLDPAKYVSDAADEIDMSIGRKYVTPIDVSDSEGNLVSRPVRLFLKRVNASLASGRLLLAVASPEEQRQLHAYAWSLVQEAQTAIASVVSGDVTLDGALPVETTDNSTVTVPLISNIDSESNVEAFYDRVVNPAFHLGYGESYRRGGHG